MKRFRARVASRGLTRRLGGGPRVISYTAANAVVSILAGKGTLDYIDATGILAGFRYPSGVLQLSDGNILVCDAGNNRIRIVTPEGVVTTLAGSTQGLLDGTGAAANFYYPQEACVMPSDGKIIVSDRFNNRLRLVTYPGGVVTTFAAGGGFNSPIGVAVIPSTGHFVVGDAGNNVVKHVTYPGGVVTTLASGFSDLQGVAVLPNGNIVVSEYTGNRIKLVTTSTYAANSGVVTTLAGSGTGQFADGTGAAASFYTPVGLAVLPNGNILVADRSTGRLRMITSSTYAANSGVVTTLLNLSGGGGGLDGVGVLSNGNIVIGGTFTQRIHILSFT